MGQASPRISQDFLTDLQRRETQDKCVLVKSGVIANDQVHKGPLAGPFSAHIICLSQVAQCVIQYSAFLVGLKICFIKQQLHSKLNIKSGVLTQEQGGLFFCQHLLRCMKFLTKQHRLHIYTHFQPESSLLSSVLYLVLPSCSHPFGVHCSLGSLAVHFKATLDRDTQIVWGEARYLHIKTFQEIS